MNPVDLLDYATLRMIWWVLMGILLIGFALTDGFDLGSLILMPIIGRSDAERRVIINAIGPVWEGNQVWLILGAGAIFAAWPMVYATVFSGLYLAMILILAGLVLRPVAIIYRSKVPDRFWRACWDRVMQVASLLPPVLFGVALGNVLQGLPFHYDESMRLVYTGGFVDLLNPFALLTGGVALAMTVMHGGAWLAVKCEETIAFRARVAGFIGALLLMVLFAGAGAWTAVRIKGFAIAGDVAHNAASNPMTKVVSQSLGGWLANYGAHPWLMAAPLLGIFGAAVAAYLLTRGHDRGALIASGLSVFGVVATLGVSMFPFILPSSLDPRSSLTVWDSSSSKATLFTMLAVTCLILPVILAYTAFIYSVLRGRVSVQDIEADHGSY
jgi:cytochrome d ubiquinol oxidase subunit II